MNQKIENLRKRLVEAELDGIIIENPINVRYLTGIKAEGILIINDKENTFITDSRYIEDVNNTLTIEDEINLVDSIDLGEEDYLSFFQECNKIGFEENHITYAEYINSVRKYRPKEYVEASSILENMRLIKDEEEILKIETACNITDSCFLHLQDFIKIGMTEREIVFEIQRFFYEKGAEGVAFDTIVASGPNSSKPHAIPTDRKIQKGDPILIDFGAKYEGYCADMTRMLFVGEISKELEELYNFILKGQNRAFEKMKNGADGREIAKGVQSEYYARDYDLIHALGHGVGMEVHEKPIISTRCNSILQENMVVTNEPGIYIPGVVGIRIEDTVLINNMTARNLTKSNKNLIII